MRSNGPQEKQKESSTLSFLVLGDLERKLQNTITYAKKLILEKVHLISLTDGDMETN